MASSASTTMPTKQEWDQRIWAAKPPKSDINAIILDYLTMEGYPKAAANFCKEANLGAQDDQDFVQTRWEIRQHIHSGDFEAAIESLNEIDPDILESDNYLHFSLLRLQLIEIIKKVNVPGGDIAQALTFATEHLGPRASASPQFLEDLEKTMALLMIPWDQLEPPLAALLDPSLRQDAAEQVNGAILASRSKRTTAGIRNLVKMHCWAENRSRDLGLAIPDKLDIGLRGDDSEGRGSSGENGHDPMITT